MWIKKLFNLGKKKDNQGYVLALLIDNDNRMVLMGQRKDTGKWSFIGGGIKENETPKEAILREINEETGLTYSDRDLELIGQSENKEKEPIYMFKLIIDPYTQEPNPNLDIDNEFEKLELIPIKALLKQRLDLQFPYDENVGIQALQEMFKDINLDEIENDKIDIHIKKSHKGLFTKWCKEQGYESVTDECIKKGLKSEDEKVKKEAVFANNARKWHHKKHTQDELNLNLDEVADIENNLLWKIKNETRATKKIKLIKEFKSLKATQKLKITKEYKEWEKNQDSEVASKTTNKETQPQPAETNQNENNENNENSTILDEIYKKSIKILDKGLDITLDDLSYFDTLQKYNGRFEDIGTIIENEIQKGNKEYKKLEDKLKEVISLFQATMDSIQLDSVEADNVNQTKLADLLSKMFLENKVNNDKNADDRLRAFNKLRKLMDTDLTIKRQVEQIIEDIESENADNKTPSLFDSLLKD